jgi:hypothetical protein
MEIVFEWPTWCLVTLIFAAMLVANEWGFRLGRHRNQLETEVSRSVSNALKGSILGLVALLLGFSFSATTNRHDLRQRLVLDQANAIGTCHLRAGLLEEPDRQQIQRILKDYVDIRLEHIRLTEDLAAENRNQSEIDRLLRELWEAVEGANRKSPEIVRNSLIVSAANDVIDFSSARTWANRNHLPNPVLALLLISVVVSSLLIGHSSGQSNRRHFVLWLATNLVVVLVLFVVLDFDRPRRGLIRVDQTPLRELQESFSSLPIE